MKRIENKINFLQETYESEKTRKSYLSTFKNFLSVVEQGKDKDIYEFTYQDLDDLFVALPTTNVSVRRSVVSLVNNYIEWAIKRGYRQDANPLDGKDLDKYYKISSNVAKNKYISRFWLSNMINKAMIETNLDMQQLIILVLARYGIVGKEFEWGLNLKWEDIDEKNMIVNIWDKKRERIITTLPIDKLFLQYIEQAKKTDSLISDDGKRFDYEDDGYVIKSSSKKKNYRPVFASINSTSYRIFNHMGIKRISFTMLKNSRKLDLIFEIKAHKGYLDLGDFKNVTYMFTPEVSYTAYIRLMEMYIAINGVNDVIGSKGAITK